MSFLLLIRPSRCANTPPAYNYSDDPQYPAAFYAPGTAFEITGQKWRSEYIPGVTVEQITFTDNSDDITTLLAKVEVTIIEQD